PSGSSGMRFGSAAAARASSNRAWPSRSRAMFASAMSSSRSGARAHHSEIRWDRTRASSPSMRQYAPRSAASTPSGTVVSTPASGSSKSVPKAQFASLTSRPEYALSCVSCSTLVPASSCSTLIVGSSPAGVGWLPAGVRSVVMSLPSSHVRDIVGDVVEGRVTVDLVTAGGEHRVLLVRARGRDIGGADDPDAHTLVASGVDVTGVVDGHLIIGGVQRPDVDVVESALAADEDLVQRPFAAGSARRGGGVLSRRGGAGVGLGHFAA